ncbi:hypothetical protein B0H19DRAFT_1373829 [Mycena capillaripes]|nr:hypothetical protein B0H19DRAFT_1373829 [Mycena capillaripes]
MRKKHKLSASQRRGVAVVVVSITQTRTWECGKGMHGDGLHPQRKLAANEEKTHSRYMYPSTRIPRASPSTHFSPMTRETHQIRIHLQYPTSNQPYPYCFPTVRDPHRKEEGGHRTTTSLGASVITEAWDEEGAGRRQGMRP